jgi:chromosome condensin MukBEF ATPase and DNA-binding subunit MukB
MQVTRFEKDLMRITLMESVDVLNAHPLRNAEKHKDTFDKAVKARNDLLKKIESELKTTD